MTELGISQEHAFAIPRNKEGNLSWKALRKLPEEDRARIIQQETQNLIPDSVHFTANALKRAGFSGFISGVMNVYPGGFHALRADLGRDTDVEARKPVGYWTAETIEHEAASFMQEHGQINSTILKKLNRTDLITAIVKIYPGKFPALQNKLAGSELKRVEKWTSEEIFLEAKKFVDEHSDISYLLLQQEGKGDLLRAILNHFEGNLTELRATLGLKPRTTDWTVERIEEEAKQIYQSEGNISHGHLTKTGRSALASAINSKYPGAFIGLKDSLGIPIDTKPKGYWTPENMEAEALEIYNEKGDLSHRIITELGRAGLAVKITKTYPGGIRGLKEKLGIPIDTKPNGYWTQELIEQEARAFFQMHKRLSNRLLSQKNSGLYNALYRNYPGGIVALKERLGIYPTDNQEVIAPDQANAQLRGLLGEDHNE